ncbi:hypothetical protein BG28_04810 [Nesterenkonia sp. AN1]|nr:hypothetical protein BG28_04810 [Nesterenkonia sp. AN1]
MAVATLAVITSASSFDAGTGSARYSPSEPRATLSPTPCRSSLSTRTGASDSIGAALQIR